MTRHRPLLRLPATLVANAILLAAAILHSAASTSMAAVETRFALHQAPKPIPSLHFEDGSGRTVELKEFRGRVLLLNFWATWCGPCREEMPALDRLEARLGGPGFAVIAVSMDRGAEAIVEPFLSRIGIRHLRPWFDRGGGAARELGIVGLPTTLLIDREGREIGRLSGAAVWDGPEITAYLSERLTIESTGQ